MERIVRTEGWRVVGLALLCLVAIGCDNAVGTADPVDETPSTCASHSDCDTFEECLEGSCVCSDIYSPVCADDGGTYNNACLAEAASSKVLFMGQCEQPVVCEADIECESGEACLLGCKPCPKCEPCVDEGWCVPGGGQSCQLSRDCPSNLFCCGGVCGGTECPDDDSPVCGEDGRDYTNEFEARNNGVAVDYVGACLTE